MRLLQTSVAVVSLLPLWGCSATESNGIPQPAQPAPFDTYVHEPSGFQFPPSVSGVARLDVKLNDREGRDISVNYRLLQTALITISISPVGEAPPDDTLEGHVEKCKGEILAQHEGAKAVSDESVQLLAAGKRRSARHDAFTYRGLFMRRQDWLRSDLYVFSTGEWYIKFLVTYASSERSTGERVCTDFIEAFDWPKQERKNK
jgi:hypothetical protein